MSQIGFEPKMRTDLASRGVNESTGVFGDHTVQIGKGSPIRLDSIKSATIPFAGFRKVTKIARGKAGVVKSAANVLQTLASRTGTLDAGQLLGHLKALQRQTNRLDKLGQLTDAQKLDGSWTFTKAVQNLSNRELAAVYQSFSTPEMDLLQEALMYEGQSNPNAKDTRNAAAQLFDLQALVLKEISNRSVNEQISQQGLDLQFEGLFEQVDEPVDRPKTLTVQFGEIDAPSETQNVTHDISAANLLTLTEVAARSATIREKSAVLEESKLSARKIDNVTLKEMGDTLRNAELTINIKTEFLIGGENNILDHPNDPMVNIFHLHYSGIDPKSPGYLDERKSTEDVLFPELKEHHVDVDERPLYGALNVLDQKGGATSLSSGYGTSCIVLKPEAKKRATYILNDTFHSARINVSQERRQNFYNLLDGINNEEGDKHFGPDIPEQLIKALKDPHSAERKDFEAFLDKLKPNEQVVLAFKWGTAIPESIRAFFKSDGSKESEEAQESAYSSFKGLLTQCFGDSEATRECMATHDNLESLVPQMTTVNGNNLARATLDMKNGNNPKLKLQGVQYIEAQIQGPLVPSRDIAEIRVDLDDVPVDEREALKVKARQYEKDTGIKVTLFEGFKVMNLEDNGIQQVRMAQDEFNDTHLNLVAFNVVRDDYLNNLSTKINDFVAEHPDLTDGLPAGALRLEGNALQLFVGKFVEGINTEFAADKLAAPEDVVAKAFRSTVRPLLEQKATLLRELENIELNAAQKEAVTKWVVAAKALRSPLELKTILNQAKRQAEVMRGIAGTEPAPSPQEIFRRISAFAQDMNRELVETIKSFNDPNFGRDDKLTEQDRISFMSLELLRNGEPPFGAEDLQKLDARLASPEMRVMLGQIDAIMGEERLHTTEGFPQISLILNQLVITANNVRKLTHHPSVRAENFQGELSLIQEPLREVLREIAPDFAEGFDTLHPGYPPFPAPASPENMPKNESERRDFLVHTIQGYIHHEKTFEKGSSVHGRGHIARAYIFANVMCNILAEQGIQVDKNAVLCGITGHDLGRQTGGKDRWEEQSAELTTTAMSNAFGAETMGGAYEQEIKNSIIQNKSNTMEAMILNAADSLDIGRVRTRLFDLKLFSFFKGKEGETPGNEATAIRKQLAKEADLLQRLTNPLCANRKTLERLNDLTLSATTDFEQDFFYEQQKDLLRDIELEFESEWELDGDAFMRRFEDTVRGNPQMFPLLSKYYH